MRVVVTGGSGFIGSAVVRRILSEPSFEVVNLDSLTYAGNTETLADVAGNPRYVLERCDIRDFELVNWIFKKHDPDAVLHLAAESHVDRSISGPGLFVETNVIGTYSLLQAARLQWMGMPPGKKSRFRFHHVSTDEVFGSLGTVGSFTETTPYDPRSPYSATKAASDHLVRAWHHTYGLPTLVTNCSNNFGPYQYPEKLIPQTILNALAGRPIPVYGDGSNVRDWLFVQDHADALFTVLTKGVVGDTYNIGGSSERTNLEVVHKICDIVTEMLGEGFGAHHLIRRVADRPGHDFRYSIDSSKIQKELRWAPRHSFEDALRETIRWYTDNQHTWCKTVQNKSDKKEKERK